MLTIRKSAAETNDQKGSTHLLLVPHTFVSDGVSSTALHNIDYTPVKSKAAVQSELNAIMEKKAPGYEYKLAAVTQSGADFTNPDEKTPRNPLWGVLNWVLGAATFCLVAYFMTMMKGSGGGGGSGWGSSRGRKGGSPFSGFGKKGGPGGRGGGFGGARGRR